jgi:hypothetical protein
MISKKMGAIARIALLIRITNMKLIFFININNRGRVDW